MASEWDQFPAVNQGEPTNEWDAFPRANVDSGQSYVGTLASSAGRGLSSLRSGSVIGLGAVGEAFGATDNAVTEAGRELRRQEEASFPINPIYKDDFAIKASGAVGQAGGQLVASLASGGLGLGVNATRGVILGSAALQGFGGGLETAEAYGITDPVKRAATIFIGGAAEAGTEMIGGIGGSRMTSELLGKFPEAVGRFYGLKRAAKTIASEGGEEALSGAVQDVNVMALADEDPNRPGYAPTGVELPSLTSPEFYKDRLEEAALGFIGGGVFAGYQAMFNRPDTAQAYQWRKEAQGRIKELEGNAATLTPEQQEELKQLKSRDNEASSYLERHGAERMANAILQDPIQAANNMADYYTNLFNNEQNQELRQQYAVRADFWSNNTNAQSLADMAQDYVDLQNGLDEARTDESVSADQIAQMEQEISLHPLHQENQLRVENQERVMSAVDAYRASRQAAAEANAQTNPVGPAAEQVAAEVASVAPSVSQILQDNNDAINGQAAQATFDQLISTPVSTEETEVSQQPQGSPIAAQEIEQPVATSFPFEGVWSNADSDLPITITGVMGEQDGVVYYQTSTGTGVPASQVTPAQGSTAETPTITATGGLGGDVQIPETARLDARQQTGTGQEVGEGLPVSAETAGTGQAQEVQVRQPISRGVTRSAALEGVRRLSQLIPNLQQQSWVGTVAQLRDNAQFRNEYTTQLRRLNPGATVGRIMENYRAFIAAPTAQGMNLAGKSYIITDNLEVTQEDQNKAQQHGGTAQEWATVRTLLHENWHSASQAIRSSNSALSQQFNDLANQIDPAELDDLASRRYREFSNWRENQDSKERLVDEWMAERMEGVSVETLPAPTTLLGRLFNWYKQAYAYVTGLQPQDVRDAEILAMFDAWRNKTIPAQAEQPTSSLPVGQPTSGDVGATSGADATQEQTNETQTISTEGDQESGENRDGAGESRGEEPSSGQIDGGGVERSRGAEGPSATTDARGGEEQEGASVGDGAARVDEDSNLETPVSQGAALADRVLTFERSLRSQVEGLAPWTEERIASVVQWYANGAQGRPPFGILSPTGYIGIAMDAAEANAEAAALEAEAQDASVLADEAVDEQFEESTTDFAAKEQIERDILNSPVQESRPDRESNAAWYDRQPENIKTAIIQDIFNQENAGADDLGAAVGAGNIERVAEIRQQITDQVVNDYRNNPLYSNIVRFSAPTQTNLDQIKARLDAISQQHQAFREANLPTLRSVSRLLQEGPVGAYARIAQERPDELAIYNRYNDLSLRLTVAQMAAERVGLIEPLVPATTTEELPEDQFFPSWKTGNLRTQKAQRIYNAWDRISRNEDAFTLARSDATDPDELALEMTNGRIAANVFPSKGSESIVFSSPNGSLTIKSSNTSRPYIYAGSAFSSGEKKGGGSDLYQVAFTWAHNNGKTIVPSNGLTSINAFVRRTSNMLNSALRHGATRHMIPDSEQAIAGWKKGDHANNIARLAWKESSQTRYTFPALDNVRYNFQTGKFYTQAQGELSNQDLEALVKQTDPLGFANRFGIGLTTVKRAIITNTAFQEELLDEPLVAPKVLYSKNNEPSHDLSREPDERKNAYADMEANPYVSVELKDAIQVLGEKVPKKTMVEKVRPMATFARQFINDELKITSDETTFGDTDSPAVNAANTARVRKLWNRFSAQDAQFSQNYLKAFREWIPEKGPNGQALHQGGAAVGVLQLELMDYAKRLAKTANFKGKVPGSTRYRQEQSKLDLAKVMMDQANDIIVGDYMTVSNAARALQIRSMASGQQGFWKALRFVRDSMYANASESGNAQGRLDEMVAALNDPAVGANVPAEVEEWLKTKEGQKLLAILNGNPAEQAERAEEKFISDAMSEALEYLDQKNKETLSRILNNLARLKQLQAAKEFRAASSPVQQSTPSYAPIPQSDEELQKEIDSVLAAINSDLALFGKQTKTKAPKATNVATAEAEAQAMVKRLNAQKKTAAKSSPLKEAMKSQINKPKTLEEFTKDLAGLGVSPETSQAMFDIASSKRRALDSAREARKDAAETSKAIREAVELRRQQRVRKKSHEDRIKRREERDRKAMDDQAKRDQAKADKLLKDEQEAPEKEASRIIEIIDQQSLEWSGKNASKPSEVQSIKKAALLDQRTVATDASNLSRERFMSAYEQSLKDAGVKPETAKTLAARLYGENVRINSNKVVRKREQILASDSFEKNLIKRIKSLEGADPTDRQAQEIIIESFQSSGLTSFDAQDAYRAMKARVDALFTVAETKAFREQELEASRKIQSLLARDAAAPDKQAQRIIDSIDNQNTEWAPKDPAEKSLVQKIKEAALKDGRVGRSSIEGPIIERSAFISEYTEMLKDAGVNPAPARTLASRLYNENLRIQTSAFTRFRQRAVDSQSFVRSLSEQILNESKERQLNGDLRREWIKDALMERGLSETEAQAATEALDSQFKKRWDDARIFALEKAAKEMKGKQPSIESLRRAIRSDYFNPQNPAALVLAEENGFKNITDADFARLAELDALAQESEATEESRYISEMVNIIAKTRPPASMVTIIGKSYVSTVLGGLSTQSMTWTSAFFTLMTRGATNIIGTSVDAATGKIKPSQVVPSLKNSLYSFIAPYRTFLSDAKFSFKNDAYRNRMQIHLRQVDSLSSEWNKSIDKWNKLREQGVSKNPLEFLKTSVRVAYTATDFIRRSMSAADQMWGGVFFDSTIRTEAFRTLLTQAKMSTTDAEAILRNAQNQGMEAARERIAEIGQQDDMNLLTLMARDYANAAIVTQVDGLVPGFGQALSKTSSLETDFELGTRASEKGDTWDVFNILVELAKTGSANMKRHNELLGHMLTGFVTTPANLLDRSLYFTPWGFYRLYVKSKFLKQGKGDQLYTETLGTEQQRRLRQIEAYAGTFGTVILWALMNALRDEEDRPVLEVTGAGPNDRNQKEAWLKEGNTPNSIQLRVGNRMFKIPYARGGFENMNISLAILGAESDMDINVPDADKATLEYMGQFASRSIVAVGSQATFLSPKSIFAAATDPFATTKSTAKQLTFFGSNFIPFAQTVKSIEKLARGPQDTSSFEAAVVSQLPIVGSLYGSPALNFLGDKVGPGTDDGIGEIGNRAWYAGVPIGMPAMTKGDRVDIYRYIMETGISPSSPSRRTLEQRNGFVTDEQWLDFVRIRGSMIVDGMRSRLSELQVLPKADAEKIVDGIASKANADTKKRLNLK